MPESTFQERLALDLTPALYEQIRATWVLHSRGLAARDLEEILRTLVEDCTYEIVPMEQQWEGHDGAREFYREMFEAFPDVEFRVHEIVIGPQGVFQYGTMKGTSRGWWGGLPPTGRAIELKLIVFFPWNTNEGKFAGERVWFV